jgi:hypothetical protein
MDKHTAADDAEVMRIWRECGLPEYFLGNGGSNHKLVAFAKACAALAPVHTVGGGDDSSPAGGDARPWRTIDFILERIDQIASEGGRVEQLLANLGRIRGCVQSLQIHIAQSKQAAAVAGGDGKGDGDD